MKNENKTKATFKFPITLLASLRKICKMLDLEQQSVVVSAVEEKVRQLLNVPPSVLRSNKNKIGPLVDDVEELKLQIVDLEKANKVLQNMVKGE